MKEIRFSLKRVEEESNAELDACKLLGAPVFPAGLLDNAPLEDEDYFVAQINCSLLPKNPPFPETGFIYIFVNIDTLQPKVFYLNEEPEELVDDFNDHFDEESCGDPTCLQMVFGEEGGSYLFGEVDYDLGLEGYTELEEKVTLLQIDAYNLPEGEQRPLIFGNYGMADGHWVFLIKEDDLKRCYFRNVELIETEA